jgi:peptidylprolyl isomerase/peptidyl-prolyl cis-trans isomerase D
MPIMTRMRDSMPIILFGLLIAFLITIIFEWGMDYLGIRSGTQELLGNINGRKVTYQEFSELVRSLSEQQKARTGQDPDETQTQQIREQVWQSLITQTLVEQEIQRLGLTVSDQEIVDWVRGDNPPEDLRRYFIDSTGMFNRAMYDQFLSNPNQFIQDPSGADPNYGTRWLADYEKNLRQRRLQEKLQSLLTATVRVGEGEILRRYTEQSVTYNVLYAAFDANSLVKDEEVSVTDADLKAYYDEHLDQYKIEAVRNLKYVFLPESPVAADTAERQKDIAEAAAKARAGEDFLYLLASYSDRPDSGAYFAPGELTPELGQAVAAAKTGDVVGPLLEGDTWKVVKVLDQRAGKNEFVRARHILFPLRGDTVAVKAQAQSVLAMARSGKDFAALAAEYSKDGSAPRGGDLGWFGRGTMVAPFEQAAFKARPGDVVGLVRTQFGLHIIKVEARSNREVKLATISAKITPSPQTRSDLFERARDFAYNARESEFTREAQALGFEVRDAQVQEKGGFIAGLGVHEGLTRWAFKEKVGEVSEPFTVPGGYAVVTIVESKEAGVRPLEEVKETLRPLVLREKKLERAAQMASQIKSQLSPGDSLTKIRQINPAIPVTETGPFVAAGTVPGVGRDPRFIGATEGLPPGAISGPVEGLRGAYLLQLLSRSGFDSTAYAAQREMLASRLLAEKRSQFVNDWLQQLREQAEIEDNRDLYR